MSCEPVIKLSGLCKCYHLYDKPRDRLLQMLRRGKRQYYREFWALNKIDLDVMPGDVVGVVGSNGAGKSTLLQLVCGTLAPTHGEISVKGRIAALLELGAGFNREFTGRENVFLSAAVTGMKQSEIQKRFEAIVDFSGIRDFIDQPVKTYSSGMYVRLAFAVAIHIDPDILIIDEALSVGDGDFSRKSFDRIVEMKKAGKTILFCSHALYQVEAICNKAIWLDNGHVRVHGEPSKVVAAYRDMLNSAQTPTKTSKDSQASQATTSSAKVARISGVSVAVDGCSSDQHKLASGESEVVVAVAYEAPEELPAPNVGICFVKKNGQIVASAGTHIDAYLPKKTARGGQVSVTFPDFPLLKGEYQVDVYLMCEQGIHVYDTVNMAAQLEVTQDSLELGVVSLRHIWGAETGA